MPRARARTAMPLLAALTLVTGTGCASVARSLSTPTTPPSGQVRAGALLQVHDPGHVSGTAPASCHAGAGPTPDPACTPGAVDPAVTEADIKTTICRTGYTKTVRPPADETDQLKRQMYRAYGIPSGATSELDHLVPLELGGANDAANLWPEVGKIPNPKDKVELALNKAVCSGRVTLAAAQQAIAANWTTAEQKLGLT